MNKLLLTTTLLMGILTQYAMAAKKVKFKLERCSKTSKYLYCESNKIANLSHEGKPRLIISSHKKSKTYNLKLELTALQASKYQLPETVIIKDLSLGEVDILSGDFGYYDQGHFPFYKKLYKRSSKKAPVSFFTKIIVEKSMVFLPNLEVSINKDDLTKAALNFSWQHQKEQAKEESHINFKLAQ